MNTRSARPDGKIQKGLFHTPFWLAPEKDIFASRAVRFKELAQEDGSGWSGYLSLLSVICEAQQAAFNRHTFPLPPLYRGQTVLPEAAQGEVPDGFLTVFTDLLNATDGQTNAAVAAETAKLKALTAAEAAALARRILTQQTEPSDRAAEIWVQAALQVVWTAWAAQLSEDDVPTAENSDRISCPCCGTEAVGSVILIRSDLTGFRYMHCPLCNSRWNALRAKCPTCGDAGGMRLQQVEEKSAPHLAPAYAAAHAESCESCHTYRKLYRQDKQQYADPVADDLATLGLDIAVGEAGYERGGANPFLLIDDGSCVQI